MKPDWYTKIVLTLIAVFLGLIACGRPGDASPAKAAGAAGAGAAAGAYDDVVVFAQGENLAMFNKRTGELWGYSLGLGGKAMLIGTIPRPGADVRFSESARKLMDLSMKGPPPLR